MLQDNIEKVINIAQKYHLTTSQFQELWMIIEPIFIHTEFQRRMTDEYPHHDLVTLGEHIISDTIVTYILSKKQKTDYNLKTALHISMFHDLYTLPWQNNKENKRYKLFNMHGFTHPIEAVVNAATWYPTYFEKESESKKIVDGVIHHMYPFPVRAVDKNDMELNNATSYEKLPNSIKEQIKDSTSRGNIRFSFLSKGKNEFLKGTVSLSRSLYKEGNVMSKADKIVSFKKDFTINGAIACVTGYNKNLEQNTYYSKSK